MIRSPRIEVNQVLREEGNSVIPLASFGDKLLTVSSDSVYTIHQNGISVCTTKKLDQAVEKYNSLVGDQTVIKKTFERDPKKLYETIHTGPIVKYLK